MEPFSLPLLVKTEQVNREMLGTGTQAGALPDGQAWASPRGPQLLPEACPRPCSLHFAWWAHSSQEEVWGRA